MSGFVKKVIRLTPIGMVAKAAAKKPKPASTPTMDDAAQRLAQADRIQRRRGVLATLFGGQSNSAPSVGTKTLTGM